MITEIEIKKLFGQFNYNLKFDFQERDNLVLVTAPNGFGKSTLLRLIQSLFTKKFDDLYNENFQEVTIHTDIKSVRIEKIKDSNKLKFSSDEETFIFDVLKHLKKIRFEKKVYFDLFDDEVVHRKSDIEIKIDEWLDKFIQSEKTEFISTNRLYLEDKSKKTLVIKDLSDSISKKINNFVNNQYDLSKTQENSFHRRILNGLRVNRDRNISISTVNDKVKELVEYNNEYNKIFGSVKLDLDESLFNEFSDSELKENRPFLMVLDEYLNDIVKRSRQFKQLGEKLKLFTDSVNDLLLFKQIEVDREKGIILSDTSISLEGLSSGEQHLLILIGKLIFEIEENTMVLIDEPEISLHPAWQEKIIEIFDKIKEINNLKIIIATHSPALIGERWSQTIELAELLENFNA